MSDTLHQNFWLLHIGTTANILDLEHDESESMLLSPFLSRSSLVINHDTGSRSGLILIFIMINAFMTRHSTMLSAARSNHRLEMATIDQRPHVEIEIQYKAIFNENALSLSNWNNPHNIFLWTGFGRITRRLLASSHTAVICTALKNGRP